MLWLVILFILGFVALVSCLVTLDLCLVAFILLVDGLVHSWLAGLVVRVASSSVFAIISLVGRLLLFLDFVRLSVLLLATFRVLARLVLMGILVSALAAN